MSSTRSTRIWVARPDEAAEVTRLLAGFRDWLHSDGPSDESLARSVTLLLEDEATEYLLARVGEGDRACAVCQLRFRHSVWTGTPDCWLEDLFVESSSRGGGIGRALVEFAFERARARGAARIELDTNEENDRAIALYESAGFSDRSKVHEGLAGRDVFMGRALR